MPGEFDFIEWVRAQKPGPARGAASGAAALPADFVLVPPGDDLAALRWPAGDLLLVGVDQVLDGVHFDSAVHGPRLVGRKVMNRNLSDCAAMACLPAAAVATVALPRGMPGGVEFLKETFLGLRDAADPFGCPVVGGDTGSWEGKLVVTVTVLGRSAGVTPITRGGARPGDGVYVTGPLGGSILGRHMTFTPRVRLARELAAGGNVTAMIDLSDGLSRDLGHVCRQSGVGAVIEADKIPVHADALELSQRDGVGCLRHALDDGEDHELLLTGRDVNPAMAVRVGRITEGREVLLQTGRGSVPLEPRGWEHSL